MVLSAALMSVAINPGKLPDWRLLLAFGLALQLVSVPDWIKYTLGSAVLALSCRILYEAPGSKLLETRVLLAFGAASFSIYLYQQLFFMLGIAHLGGLPCLALATGIGFLMHHLCDKRMNVASASLLLRLLRKHTFKAPT
jgi:peptidoglycan/LPS O-acetylase OafA/YrhL